MRRRALPFAVALCLLIPGALRAAGAVLPFVEDDYVRARAEAIRRRVPLFLEAWAPWCHSCRSMRAYVYTDARLARYADRFVWLAIDTEKPGNAAVVARYPVGAWPSMYVIDAHAETVEKRWTGSATVEQLARFLDEALVVAPAAGGDPLAVALARADRLYGAGDWSAAATAFGDLIARAPREWPGLPRAADARLFALVKSEQEAECARAARELLPRLAGTPSGATVAATGLDCALALEPAAPGRAAAIAELEPAARAALADSSLGLAADDRSGLYISLVSARDDAGDQPGKRRLCDEWIALLEESAEQAPNAEARAVFDSHRLSAYLEVGAPERAVPMLEASEKALPDDYNPPARLAVALHAMKQDARALAASDRALARSYGPRRLGILRTRSQIQAALGDPAAARATLEQAIAEGEALGPAQRSERTLTSLRGELEALPKS